MRKIGFLRVLAGAGLALLAACARPPVETAPNMETGAVGQPETTPGATPSGMPLAPNPMIGGVAMYPSRDLLDNLAQSPLHQRLSAALAAAGLADRLRQPGLFTLFAPTDAAFAALPPGLLDRLMQPAERARLTALLEGHVVTGRLDSSTLGQRVADGNGTTTLTTLAGSPLVARQNGAVNLLLRDGAGDFVDISIYDVVSANGVIHVVDQVLRPTATP